MTVSKGVQPGETGPLPPFKPWQPERPHQRSASRRVVAAVVGAVLLLLVVLVVVFFARRPGATGPVGPGSQPREVPGSVRTDTIPDPGVDAAESAVAVRIRSGEVLSGALARVGTPDSLAARAIASLEDGGFNFRRLRPGDSLEVFTDDAGRWCLRYRAGAERVWFVRLGPPDRVAMLLPRAERVTAVISGSIRSSLWDALIQQGEQPALVLDFAEVLGWEVDFFTETQAGDSFSILVTRRMQDSTVIGYEPVSGVRYRGVVGDFAGFRFTDPEGRVDYYNPNGECMRKTFLKSPLNFARVTSFFGRRFHPIHRTWRQHHGLDYAAPTGTPVSTVADGRVAVAGWMGGYGNCVDVVHPDGYRTRYGHLSRFGAGVKVGATVSQGQVVGYVGSTGVSTGPHLHFELHSNGVPKNPLRFDPPRVEPVKPEFLAAFAAARDSLLDLAPALRPRR